MPGEPLCRECFDYTAAVRWNHTLGELWRYTTIYVPRALARLAGMTQAALKRQVRVVYVKVAEYQRRGLVHVHVLARLDRAVPDYRAELIRPPAQRFDAQLLERAIREAVADVSAPVPAELGRACALGRSARRAPPRPGDARGEVAGYLAKYATKSTEQAGGLLHRVAADDVDVVNVREHVRDYLRAAFDLDATAKQRAPRRTYPAPPRSTSRPTGTRPRSPSACSAR